MASPLDEGKGAVPHAAFTLRQLECFAAVAASGSVAAAAESLHASESAVSEAITALERAVGAMLIRRRRSRGTTLTSEGLAVLPVAHRMLASAEELAASVRGGPGLSGPIRVGAVDTLAPTLLPRIVERLAARHPELHLEPRTGDSPELLEALEAGELDALLAFDIDLPPELARREIGTTRAAIVVSAEHPLARRAAASLDELRDEPMVLLDIQASRVHTLELMSNRGISPRVAFRTSSYELCRSLVARGLGWTLLMRRAASRDTWDGGRIAVVDIEPAPRAIPLVIAWPTTASPARVGALVEVAAELGASLEETESGS